MSNQLTIGWDISLFWNSSLKLHFPLLREKTLPLNSLAWSNLEVVAPVRDELVACKETSENKPQEFWT